MELGFSRAALLAGACYVLCAGTLLSGKPASSTL
jgi:hypothetical protein